MALKKASSICAIVPAAGVGRRMKQTLPKQYIRIGQCTVLEHTIACLLAHPLISRIIIALHPHDPYFPQLPLASHPKIETVDGGQARADSVLAGLHRLNETDWALVHDAARPCLAQSDLDRLIKRSLATGKGGILATPISDTIKRVSMPSEHIETKENGIVMTPHIVETVDRRQLWRALTPQLFPAGLLKQCLLTVMAKQQIMTDEASALELCGYQPEIIEGRSDNIKITRPEDIALAQFYLSQNKRSSCE